MINGILTISCIFGEIYFSSLIEKHCSVSCNQVKQVWALRTADSKVHTTGFQQRLNLEIIIANYWFQFSTNHLYMNLYNSPHNCVIFKIMFWSLLSFSIFSTYYHGTRGYSTWFIFLHIFFPIQNVGLNI